MQPDQTPQPLTDVRMAKRQAKTSRTPEQRWDRLQREFLRAVWVEYPNPEREGCPGTEALRDLAERMVLREDLQRDLRWKHAIQCGPCFEEYVVLRDTCLTSRRQAG